MLYARNSEDEIIEAAPKSKAICPHCGDTVLARCGKINAWHWAHTASASCDSWSEHETEWHLNWKRLFPRQMVEQTFKKDGRPDQTHRADVSTGKYILELQHSPISIDEMFVRQWFYGDSLIWLFDLTKVNPYPDDPYFDLRDHGDYATFRWKHPKKHVAYARKAALDLGGDRIFILQKMYPDAPCGGRGLLWTKQQFIKLLMP